jgi:serine/threonine protein kinase
MVEDATVPHPAPPAAGEPAPRMRPTWGLRAGDSIGAGRTVLRALGGGRVTEVLLVWDERRLVPMVAKLLRPDQAASPHARAELRREADALAALAHPMLVRGFTADVDGRFPHLLLEHLEGPTLRSLLAADGPLSLAQALPLALQTASVLHFMAGEGWVHLDVKPDNIVMGLPPRLLDLSVARRTADAARLRGPVGTDAYMAPEQCGTGAGRVGPAADVWGLGATLHHAISGRIPFPRPPGARAAADPRLRFPQLVRAPEPLPPRVPAALRELIAGALAFDAADRPAAAELAAGLEPLLDELPRRRRLGLRRR